MGKIIYLDDYRKTPVQQKNYSENPFDDLEIPPEIYEEILNLMHDLGLNLESDPPLVIYFIDDKQTLEENTILHLVEEDEDN